MLFEAVLLPAGGTSRARVAGSGGALGAASGAAPGAALALPCTDSAVLFTKVVLFSAYASHMYTFQLWCMSSAGLLASIGETFSLAANLHISALTTGGRKKQSGSAACPPLEAAKEIKY